MVDPHIVLVDYTCKLTKPSSHDVCYHLAASANLEEPTEEMNGNKCFVTAKLTATSEVSRRIAHECGL